MRAATDAGPLVVAALRSSRNVVVTSSGTVTLTVPVAATVWPKASRVGASVSGGP